MRQKFFEQLYSRKTPKQLFFRGRKRGEKKFWTVFREKTRKSINFFKKSAKIMQFYAFLKQQDAIRRDNFDRRSFKYRPKNIDLRVIAIGII